MALIDMDFANGGSGARAYIDTFASVTAGQSIPLGFYPDHISISFNNNEYYNFWDKNINDGKVLQLYGQQITWFTFPQNYYMGIADVDANGNLTLTYSATNVVICAYKE